MAADRELAEIMTVDHIAPQPPPKNDPDTKPLWPPIISEIRTNHDSEVSRLVAADMQKRHEFGVAKYGVPLVAKNDRDHLVDAYQEILDGIVYFRAEIERCKKFDRKATTRRLNAVKRMYKTLVEMAIELRDLILERDGQ